MSFNVPQYVRVAEILQRRIVNGDYLMRDIPSGRALAEQFGVSHIVVRGALDLLVRQKVISRKSNGRLSANPPAGAGSISRPGAATIQS